MNPDPDRLRAEYTQTSTAQLEQLLARKCRTFASIGHFPDRRRAADRPYFLLVDEVNRRNLSSPPTST